MKFEASQYKKHIIAFIRERVKSEFGFDTEAAARRSVAKRMSELLTLSLMKG